MQLDCSTPAEHSKKVTLTRRKQFPISKYNGEEVELRQKTPRRPRLQATGPENLRAFASRETRVLDEPGIAALLKIVLGEDHNEMQLLENLNLWTRGHLINTRLQHLKNKTNRKPGLHGTTWPGHSTFVQRIPENPVSSWIRFFPIVLPPVLAGCANVWSWRLEWRHLRSFSDSSGVSCAVVVPSERSVQKPRNHLSRQDVGNNTILRIIADPVIKIVANARKEMPGAAISGNCQAKR
ncbi:hypothetical protein FB451DRAFT_1185423 [Mycena latifolia]|nr:hypothetical protein FB451DRAFT_1185423 [Mycena latifolia]